MTYLLIALFIVLIIIITCYICSNSFTNCESFSDTYPPLTYGGSPINLYSSNGGLLSLPSSMPGIYFGNGKVQVPNSYLYRTMPTLTIDDPLEVTDDSVTLGSEYKLQKKRLA